MNNLELEVENLENRRMLAADLSLTGSVLNIVGDDDADQIEVVGTGELGQIEVFENYELLGQFDGVKSIKVNLRGGDDSLNVSAIQISKNLSVRMGTGVDEFDMDNDVPHLDYSQGEDGNLFIGGDVWANMGGNEGDKVDWNAGRHDKFEIGDDVTLLAAAEVDLDGSGGTSDVEDDDITIGDRLKITLRNSSAYLDAVKFDDVSVLGKTVIFGSHADESVEIGESFFGDTLTVKLGGGDDTVEFKRHDESRLLSRVILDGGAGANDEITGLFNSEFRDELLVSKGFEQDDSLFA